MADVEHLWTACQEALQTQVETATGYAANSDSFATDPLLFQIEPLLSTLQAGNAVTSSDLSAAQLNVDGNVSVTLKTQNPGYYTEQALRLEINDPHSEPLTLPPKRRQQLAVAVVVGALAGWPIDLGFVTLGQERALLIGNLLALVLAGRAAVRLRVTRRRQITPTATELTFEAPPGLSFEPGQYLELSVPHRRPDARGTRREFSIVSAPSELPELRIAYRGGPAARSTFKRRLGHAEPGETLTATGVWGDFVLPSDPAAPVLMVAAGIGVTPFISQLRHLGTVGGRRDVVLVYLVRDVSDLPFMDEISASGVPVVLAAPTRPDTLPDGWTWVGDRPLDEAGLTRVVPDLPNRRAFVSGSPAAIAQLTPALSAARSVTTDAFSGY